MKTILIFLILILPFRFTPKNEPTKFSKKTSEFKTNEFTALANPDQEVPKDIIRIIKSGNGRSIETAFEVYTVEEEFKLLRFLKLTPIMQKFDIKDGVFYDSFKTDSRTIYFKVLSVTVVDAFNFFKDFGSAQTLEDIKATNIENDNRTIVNLLVDQVEFANVIVLNKTDLVTQKQLEILKASIQKLNPVARIIFSELGKVNPNEIINTGLFNYEEAETSAGWIRELEGIHTPETEEYGISSFVFRDPRPFHPYRLWDFISKNFPQTVIRSKGLFWIASRAEQAINWSQAGCSMKAESAGVWWASMPLSERENFNNFVENQDIIEERWTLDFGDRLNELVFIGISFDENEVRQQLENCLCTADEIMDLQDGFFSNKDPFPIPRANALQGETAFLND
jgi:G3E family GTPase